MKPKNAIQERVYHLSDTLLLNVNLKTWAFDKVAEHFGHRTKTKGTACLSCGHIYQGSPTVSSEKCPSCDRKLVIKTTAKKKVRQRLFFYVIQTCKEFQVNRTFEMYVYNKAGESPRIFLSEVVQQWIQPEGKDIIVARIFGGLGGFDNFHGDLEIRRTQDQYGNNKILQQYDIYPDKIFPKMKVLPVFKLRGFKGDFHKITPYRFFKFLVSDTQGETLLKTNQTALIKCQINDKGNSIRAHWDSVKIAIRHKYTIADGGIWLDYLDLLHYFGKDLHSPKYVCPDNLKAEHDKLMVKKQAIQKLQRAWVDYEHVCEYLGEEKNDNLRDKLVSLQLETTRLSAHMRERQRQTQEKNKKKKAHRDDGNYIKAKNKYFDLEFTSGNLTITVLKSVKEFLAEAEALRHCVFSNEYYKKDNSLVFSAKINGERVETIELLLDSMTITQSRGLNNLNTKHNERIVKLMKKNIGKIAKVYNTQAITRQFKKANKQQIAA